MGIGSIAEAVGKGLFAGLAGTAAMTLSSTLEAKLRDRGSSDAPSKVAGKVLGVQPRHPAGRKRFSTAVHWGYGTTWGAARGLIGAAGLSGPAASAVHFAAVWGAALVMLPQMDAAPPVPEWGAEEVAIDAGHHLVYAAATGAAYRFLEQHR